MKDHNYTEADIQKYILDELSEEERIKFERTMNDNPDFAVKVKEQKNIAEGIEYFGAQRFKSRTKEIYSEVREEIIKPTNTKKNIFTKYRIAAVVIMILFVLFFVLRFFNTPNNDSPQSIYAQYFTSYDWSPNLRSEVSNNELDRAFEFYSSQSFEEALPLLEKIIEEVPTDIPARLAIANCHLKTNNPKLAIPQLEFILNLDDILYQDQANWYLALGYLKMGQIEDAKKVLLILASDANADYNSQAEEILLNLN